MSPKFPLLGFSSPDAASLSLFGLFSVAGCQSVLPPNNFQKCLTFVVLTAVCLYPPLPAPSPPFSLFDSDVKSPPRLS